MKAIADDYAVPAAAVLAIEAGLRRRADLQRRPRRCRPRRSRRSSTRSKTGALRLTRVEDALKRQQRAKERFLAGAASPPARRSQRAARFARQVIGRDEHRAIADEMARVRCDAETARPEAWRSPRRRRSRQPVRPRRVRRRRRRNPPSRVRAGLRRLGIRAAAIPGRVRRRCAPPRFAAWRDPAIAGIIGVRGGYGSAQLLPLLDPEEARRARKPFIGYSDLTSLLTFLTIGCGWSRSTVRCWPDGWAGGEAGYDRDSLIARCAGREPMGELAPRGARDLRRGEAARPAARRNADAACWRRWGRRLPSRRRRVTCCSSKRSGERPYRLDRMVTQLRQTGLLARASRRRHRRAAEVRRAVRRSDRPRGDGGSVRRFPGPVLFGFPSGHTTGPAMTLPFGVSAGRRDGRRVVIEESRRIASQVPLSFIALRDLKPRRLKPKLQR